MVNDDAKMHIALPVTNTGMNEVKDYADELEPACRQAGRCLESPFL